LIAVDTNILVYAHRTDSPFHALAARKITELAEGASAWAIPWPCVHELLSVVTNLRIFQPPTALTVALDYIDGLFQSPNLTLLAETDLHWSALRPLMAAARIVGGRVHDARIAAICMQHGVTELWSADRDFSRFPNLTVVNPLIS
jgi:toxin-antitoxin system PIN domain toxin